jgi:hypothetical protein
MILSRLIVLRGVGAHGAPRIRIWIDGFEALAVNLSRTLIVWLGAALGACGGGGGGGPAPAASEPEPPSAEPASIESPAVNSFIEATVASNIAYEVGFTDSYLGNATFGGAAAGDCDGDGDIDLFITRGDIGPNRLYRNLGNLTFQDTAAASGVAITRSDGRGNNRHSAPTFADLDGDFDLDLFIGGMFGDPNKLYRNNGDCSFEDVTDASGVAELIADDTISAGFGDYDLDGDLDLFLTHWYTPDDTYAPGLSEHLFENVSADSAIRFINVSTPTGVTEILLETRKYTEVIGDSSLTATFADINGDEFPDIAIAGDYGTSQLLINADGESFVNGTTENLRDAQYGMGAALGDIDFDGDLDWFITSISGDSPTNVLDPKGNRLFRNDDGVFVDVTDAAGVADGGWGWGACFLDLDNDTDLDIFHTNGWWDEGYGDNYVDDLSVAFVADAQGSYSQQSDALGLATADSGRGVVCADFDLDGDVDILELTKQGPHLWENTSAASGNNFLRIKLIGAPPNTDAAGARIYVTIGDKILMREVIVGGNLTSQHPSVQYFGLGAATMADEIRVRWPPRLPGPTRPPSWRRRNVAAGSVGETLVICHPDIEPPPARCSPL